MPSGLIVYRTTDLNTVNTYRKALAARSDWADNVAFATDVSRAAQKEVDRLGPRPGLASALDDMPVVFREGRLTHRPIISLDDDSLTVQWDHELPGQLLAEVGDQWERIAATAAQLVALAERVNEMTLRDELQFRLHQSRFENFLVSPHGSWDVADVMDAIWPTVEAAVRTGRL